MPINEIQFDDNNESKSIRSVAKLNFFQITELKLKQPTNW